MTDVTPLSIEGAWRIDGPCHVDDRGSFRESFRADLLAPHIGHRLQVEQTNVSVSALGVVRGIHFAEAPPSQAKYVTAVHGTLIDVVVDVRVGSPTFGRWEAVPLEGGAGTAVYLSEGLGHALVATSEQAVAVYLCSQIYNPAREHGVHPLDPAIGVELPPGRAPLLSPKDAAAPTLALARTAGLLPDYAACRAYRASLAETAPPVTSES